MAKPAGQPMTRTGFCQHPSEGSHELCAIREFSCTCPCHEVVDKKRVSKTNA